MPSSPPSHPRSSASTFPKLNLQPIGDETWEGISSEFTLPALELVRRRLSELMEDGTAPSAGHVTRLLSPQFQTVSLNITTEPWPSCTRIRPRPP